MKNLITLLFSLFFTQIYFSQNVQFISETSGNPLSKVLVLDNSGSIVAISDIDGKISKSSLDPQKGNFEIYYNNQAVETLKYSDFDKNQIKIVEKYINIEPVVIKKNDNAKYVFVRGYFNSYGTINNKLDCYVDGVVTYIFDRKTNKLKKRKLEQYRVFKTEKNSSDRKNTTTAFDFRAFLSVFPNLDDVGNYENYFKGKPFAKRFTKGTYKDEIEVYNKHLQKEKKFLGYRFFDVTEYQNVSYEKDSKKTLRDLLEYNEVNGMKLMHKSEPQYNQLTVYNNFYPIEFSFEEDDDDSGKIKYDVRNSNYTAKFWELPSFPSMQNVFEKFYKNELKEEPNINR